MSHLTPESFARLVDESPTASEQTHLDACHECREAIDEMRMQTTALRALPPLAPPGDAWEKITARLDEHSVVPLQSRRRRTIATRAAAAAIIFVLGAASGAVVSRPGDSEAPPTAVAPPAASATSTVSVPTTPDLALTRLRIAEMLYTTALLDYAAATSPQLPQDAVARLATLETIVLTTRTALERAPADPLINSYHLAALAERETLLGQLRLNPEKGTWY
jgi:hypothetical protein